MQNKVAAITLHNRGIGEQMAITYAVIGDGGNVVSQNKRAEIVVSDAEVSDAVTKLYEYAQTVIDGKEV